MVRADSGGSAKQFLAYLRDAHVMFSVSVRLTDPIRAAVRVLHRHTSVWTPAITQPATCATAPTSPKPAAWSTWATTRPAPG